MLQARRDRSLQLAASNVDLQLENKKATSVTSRFLKDHDECILPAAARTKEGSSQSGGVREEGASLSANSANSSKTFTSAGGMSDEIDGFGIAVHRNADDIALSSNGKLKLRSKFFGVKFMRGKWESRFLTKNYFCGFF